MTFPHPETGELLDSREDFVRALADIEERMGPFYRLRRLIREELTERYEAAEQPAPRYRTQTQEKVARCPRCGGKDLLEEKPNQPLLNAARRLVKATDNAERNYALADLIVELESEEPPE